MLLIISVDPSVRSPACLRQLEIDVDAGNSPTEAGEFPGT
jgi:hypothetical protein